MRGLKSFFKSYKDSLSYFQQAMTINIKKLKQDLEMPTIKGGITSKTDDDADSDTFK